MNEDMKRTQVIPVTDELLDRVFPEYRLCQSDGEQAGPPVPAELICDIVDAERLRAGLDDTQEMSAVQDEEELDEHDIRVAATRRTLREGSAHWMTDYDDGQEYDS